VGPNVPHNVLKQCSIDKQTSGYYTCDDVLNDHGTASVDPVVDYDLENSRIATAALELLRRQSSMPERRDLLLFRSLTDDQIRTGVSRRPSCRFEQFTFPLLPQDSAASKIPVVLDVAHNPPAMELLAYKLQKTYPLARFRVVVGLSSDKDLQLCLQYLSPVIQGDLSRLYFVQASHPRAATLESLVDATTVITDASTANYDLDDRSISKQILAAINDMKKTTDDEVLVICGSVFIMAEARETLGFDEPRDSQYIAEVAGAGVKHGQENFANTEPERK
jgi:dihydrofolate synthase / folylpolyglutamate synthase